MLGLIKTQEAHLKNDEDFRAQDIIMENERIKMQNAQLMQKLDEVSGNRNSFDPAGSQQINSKLAQTHDEISELKMMLSNFQKEVLELDDENLRESMMHQLHSLNSNGYVECDTNVVIPGELDDFFDNEPMGGDD